LTDNRLTTLSLNVFFGNEWRQKTEVDQLTQMQIESIHYRINTVVFCPVFTKLWLAIICTDGRGRWKDECMGREK